MAGPQPHEMSTATRSQVAGVLNTLANALHSSDAPPSTAPTPSAKLLHQPSKSSLLAQQIDFKIQAHKNAKQLAIYQKHCSQSIGTTANATQRSFGNDFCEKNSAAIHFLRKPCFATPQTCGVRPNNQYKSPGNKLKQKRKLSPQYPKPFRDEVPKSLRNYT